MRAPLKSGTEQDCVYARSIYCYLQRAGAASYIKRQIRRRERRAGKREARATES